jgi:hypothetical protein
MRSLGGDQPQEMGALIQAIATLKLLSHFSLQAVPRSEEPKLGFPDRAQLEHCAPLIRTRASTRI